MAGVAGVVVLVLSSILLLAAAGVMAHSVRQLAYGVGAGVRTVAIIPPLSVNGIVIARRLATIVKGTSRCRR